MGELCFKYCLLYLDDVIVFSQIYEEHFGRLDAVFIRLKEAGLNLKPSKYSFFQRELKYLGHVVSQDGVKTDPEKIRVVQDWPVPQNVKQPQSFLGFAGFYQRFIQDFSKVAKPLHGLTQGSCGSKKSRRSKSSSGVPWSWTELHQAAFDQIKQLLTTAPVLALANYSKPFILHTVASHDGLRAVLY